jgi:hypothetical protein
MGIDVREMFCSEQAREISMSKPAAFRAVYADWKLIKTRGQVQIVLELPIEQADAAYEVLGGMPVAGKERWFGVAAIKSETEVMPVDPEPNTRTAARPDQEPPRPDRAKRDWRDMPPSQQAALRCNTVMFRAFLRDTRADDWHEAGSDPAECVRLICGVASRSLLDTEHRARVVWKQLDDQFQAWSLVSS